MARGPSRRRVVATAIRAITDAGHKVYRVDIDTAGRIMLVTSPTEPEPVKEEISEWEGADAAF